MATAQSGDTVRIHYTGTLDDGEVFDSSEGQPPLEFTLGQGEVIAGFDTAVAGMTPGEKKTVTIPAEDAYGEYRDEMVMEVDRAQLPPGMHPEEGDQLVVGTEEGDQIPVTVQAITDETILLDANHVLAGEALTFEIELVEIVPPKSRLIVPGR
jgi:peptidylprolyl isomerase